MEEVRKFYGQFQQQITVYLSYVNTYTLFFNFISKFCTRRQQHKMMFDKIQNFFSKVSGMHHIQTVDENLGFYGFDNLIMQRMKNGNIFVSISPHRILLVCISSIQTLTITQFKKIIYNIQIRLLSFRTKKFNSAESICSNTGRCNFTHQFPKR